MSEDPMSLEGGQSEPMHAGEVVQPTEPKAPESTDRQGGSSGEGANEVAGSINESFPMAMGVKPLEEIEHVPGVNASAGDLPHVDPESAKVEHDFTLDDGGKAGHMASVGHGARSYAATLRENARNMENDKGSILSDEERVDEIHNVRALAEVADQSAKEKEEKAGAKYDAEQEINDLTTQAGTETPTSEVGDVALSGTEPQLSGRYGDKYEPVKNPAKAETMAYAEKPDREEANAHLDRQDAIVGRIGELLDKSAALGGKLDESEKEEIQHARASMVYEGIDARESDKLASAKGTEAGKQYDLERKMFSSAWYERKGLEYNQKAEAIEAGRALDDLTTQELLEFTALRAMREHAADRARIAAKLEARGIDPAEILMEHQRAVPIEPEPPGGSPFENTDDRT